MRALVLAVCLLAWIGVPSKAQQDAAPKAPTDVMPGSITYDDIAYPFPVAYFPLTIYGQDVRMAYMDVPPSGAPNGRTVVLFHGMNFGGFYFAGVIEVLRKEGFRVVVPDQIGFGRSSKPIIPYNFHDMAANSRKLLQTLGIAQAAIVGHSMGGMLAARFSASYPDMTERTVIYNPIGDRRALPNAMAHRGRRLQSHYGAVARPDLSGVLRQHPPLLSVARRLEAGIRAVRADPVRPDARQRVAAAGHGAGDLSTDHLS